MPLGRVALKHGIIGMSEVFEVLKLQTDRIGLPRERRDDLLFGDLAVELGYIGERELENLLQLQRKSRPPIGEILLEMGCLTEAQLEAELIAFTECVTEDVS